MKNKKIIIVVLIGIFSILILLYMVYMLYAYFMFKYASHSVQKIIDKNTIEYKLDEENKLSEEQLKTYIKDKLYRKYNEQFEIIKIDKKNIEECKTGLDSYSCVVILENGFDYTFTLKNNNGIYFMSVYSDPYYSKSKGDDEYIFHGNKFKDNYNLMKQINENEKLKKILSEMKNYVIDNNLNLKEIYYISDRFFDYAQSVSIKLIINYSQEKNNLNIDENIRKYYSNKLDNILSLKSYIIIDNYKIYLQESGLIINGK